MVLSYCGVDKHIIFYSVDEEMEAQKGFTAITRLPCSQSENTGAEGLPSSVVGHHVIPRAEQMDLISSCTPVWEEKSPSSWSGLYEPHRSSEDSLWQWTGETWPSCSCLSISDPVLTPWPVGENWACLLINTKKVIDTARHPQVRMTEFINTLQKMAPSLPSSLKQ